MMRDRGCRSLELRGLLDRRDFLKMGGAAGVGLWLGSRSLSAPALQPSAPPPRPKTNIEDALRVPKTKYSLPGLFPGKVVEARDDGSVQDDKLVAGAIHRMFEKGLRELTGKGVKDSFGLFFSRDDVVGIKVNPVGPGTISTHHEVVDVLIEWLVAGGLRRGNIIIWDRFDYMLKGAGFTPERYPGVAIEGLQTMDEAAAMGQTQDNSRWLKTDGTHVSVDNFDQTADQDHQCPGIQEHGKWDLDGHQESRLRGRVQHQQTPRAPVL